MKRPWLRGLVLALACLGAGPLAAQTGTQTEALAEAQRGAIQARRQAVEAEHARQRQACQSRFAVTACQDEVEQSLRRELADLRRQENSLADQERKRRGAQRVGQIEARRAARRQAQPGAGGDASQGADSAAGDGDASGPAGAPPDASGTQSARRAGQAGRKPRDDESAKVAGAAARYGRLPHPTEAVREEQAQARAKAHERKLQKAKERQAAAAQRQRERQAGGATRPLPAQGPPLP